MLALTHQGIEIKSSIQLVIEALHPLSIMRVCESESSCVGREVCVHCVGELKVHILIGGIRNSACALNCVCRRRIQSTHRELP
jgi:hypothetical protein